MPARPGRCYEYRIADPSGLQTIIHFMAPKDVLWLAFQRSIINDGGPVTVEVKTGHQESAGFISRLDTKEYTFVVQLQASLNSTNFKNIEAGFPIVAQEVLDKKNKGEKEHG